MTSSSPDIQFDHGEFQRRLEAAEARLVDVELIARDTQRELLIPVATDAATTVNTNGILELHKRCLAIEAKQDAAAEVATKRHVEQTMRIARVQAVPLAAIGYLAASMRGLSVEGAIGVAGVLLVLFTAAPEASDKVITVLYRIFSRGAPAAALESTTRSDPPKGGKPA